MIGFAIRTFDRWSSCWETEMKWVGETDCYCCYLINTMKLSDIPSLALLLLLCGSVQSFSPTSIGGSKTTTQLFSTIEKDTVTTETNNAALLKRDRYIATNRKLIMSYIIWYFYIVYHMLYRIFVSYIICCVSYIISYLYVLISYANLNHLNNSNRVAWGLLPVASGWLI